MAAAAEQAANLAWARQYLDARGNDVDEGLAAARAFLAAGQCKECVEALDRLSGSVTSAEHIVERERLRGEVALRQEDFPKALAAFARCLEQSAAVRDKLPGVMLACPVTPELFDVAAQLLSRGFETASGQVRGLVQNLSEGCREVMQLRDGGRLAEELGIPFLLLRRHVVEENVWAARHWARSLRLESLALTAESSAEEAAVFLSDGGLPREGRLDEADGVVYFVETLAAKTSRGSIALIAALR